MKNNFFKKKMLILYFIKKGKSLLYQKNIKAEPNHFLWTGTELKPKFFTLTETGAGPEPLFSLGPGFWFYPQYETLLLSYPKRYFYRFSFSLG